MNPQDDRTWPEVERRESERREVGPPTHVTIDYLSQALEGRISRLEAALEQGIQVGTRVLKWVVTLVGMLVVGAFAVGGWIVFQENEIEQRPTRSVIEQLIEDKTEEQYQVLTDEIAAIKAEGRVARDASTQGMVALQLSVEALQEQSVSLRRDVDRIDRSNR